MEQLESSDFLLNYPLIANTDKILITNISDIIASTMVAPTSNNIVARLKSNN